MSEKMSLRDFIGDNYRLIATMGLAGALVTLFTGLENAEYLVIICSLMFVPMNLKLLMVCRRIKNPSLSMKIFRVLLLPLFFYVAYHLLQASYAQVSELFSSNVAFALLIIGVCILLMILTFFAFIFLTVPLIEYLFFRE
jgi:hypothetical protein